MADCKICASRDGVEYIKKLQRGEITRLDAALYFNVTNAELDDHIANHELNTVILNTPKPKFSELIQDPDFLLDKVETILNRIERWLDLAVDTEMDDLDPRSIDRGTKLVKEMRETIKMVYELQGKFNKGDTYHQQYVQIQGDYNQFTGMILDTACPSCQQKILTKINETKQLK